MIAISTNDTVLKVEGLETKFDLGIVSNSLVSLLGSYLEARIVQQIHYWTVKEYGKIINGLRWIYKPIREWLSEVLIGFTSWQIRKAIASLIEKEVLRREHLYDIHHGHNYAPKNRTYYYSLNYEKLEELVKEYETAESTENIRFVSDTKQFCENSEKQFCENTQNKTENTSTENPTRDKSHPTLPCESGSSKPSNQGKESLNTSELSTSSEEIKDSDVGQKAVEPEANSADVESNINQYKSTETATQYKSTKKDNVQDDVQDNVQVESDTSKMNAVGSAVSKPLPKTPKRTKQRREDKAPWKDEEEFKQFYQVLIQALPIVANSYSPQGLAQKIIACLRRGEPHTYWDDFKAGLPIGTSTKPEWEVEPGVPYPMFVEYLTEKIKAGNNTTSNEQTRNEVFRILSQPRQAKAFWGQFKRSVVNVADQVERDRALGVSNPNTPVWTRERVEPSISEAVTAGEKIMAVNGTTQVAVEAANNLQLEPDNSHQLKNQDGHHEHLSPQESSIPDEVEAGSALKGQSTFDPWIDEETSLACDDGDEEPQPTMKELLTKRLGNRNLKGFVKEMPQVSKASAEAEERAKKKPKTHISRMSVAEINNYLSDPILRKQIMPQLWYSDYQLIMNDLGEIIGVKQTSYEE